MIILSHLPLLTLTMRLCLYLKIHLHKSPPNNQFLYQILFLTHHDAKGLVAFPLILMIMCISFLEQISHHSLHLMQFLQVLFILCLILTLFHLIKLFLVIFILLVNLNPFPRPSKTRNGVGLRNMKFILQSKIILGAQCHYPQGRNQLVLVRYTK